MSVGPLLWVSGWQRCLDTAYPTWGRDSGSTNEVPLYLSGVTLSFLSKARAVGALTSSLVVDLGPDPPTRCTSVMVEALTVVDASWARGHGSDGITWHIGWPGVSLLNPISSSSRFFPVNIGNHQSISLN